MKVFKICITVIILISVFSFKSFAIEDIAFDDMLGDWFEDIVSSLEGDTGELLSQLGFDKISAEAVFDLSMKDIFSVLKSSFVIQLKQNSSSFFKLLSVILAMILLNTFRQSKDNEIIDDIFSLVTVVFVSSLLYDCAQLLSSVFSLTKSFLVCLTPVITVLLSASGNITFSALYSSGMIGFCQLLSLLSDEVLLPLTGVYFGLIIAMNFNEVTDAERFSAHINNAVTAVLGLVSTVFSLFLCAKNFLAKDIDNVLFSSGKYLISSFIPIIGGAVSGIMNSVIGSISLAKSTLGIFAVVAFACINIPLFIKIFFCRAMLGILSVFCDAFGQKRVTGIIKAMSQSVKLLGILAFFELITVIISTGIAAGIRGA